MGRFNLMADRYDTDERIENAKIIAENIRPFAGKGKYKKAMDYGCGTGLVGLELVDAFESILFMDSAPNMVKQVQMKLNKMKIQNGTAVCCDLLSEVQPNYHMDFIFMAQVLLHIPDVGRILSCLYQVLNPGGCFIIVDFDKNEKIVSDEVHNGFDRQELISMVKEAGFRECKAKTFYEGRKIFMNQDSSLFILDATK